MVAAATGGHPHPTVVRNRTPLYDQFRRSFRTTALPVAEARSFGGREQRYATLSSHEPALDDGAIELETFHGGAHGEAAWRQSRILRGAAAAADGSPAWALWVERKRAAAAGVQDVARAIEGLAREHSRQRVPVIDWRLGAVARTNQAEDVAIRRLADMFTATQRMIAALEGGGDHGASHPAWGGESAPDSAQVRRLKMNARRALTARLGACAEELRRVQQAHVQRACDFEARHTSPTLLAVRAPLDAAALLPAEGGGAMAARLVVGSEALSREQAREMDRALDSMREVVKLLQSMHLIVVEQGSLVDRIDYNLEQAARSVAQAHGHLAHTKTRQATIDNRKYLLLLLVLLIFFLLVAISAKLRRR